MEIPFKIVTGNMSSGGKSVEIWEYFVSSQIWNAILLTILFVFILSDYLITIYKFLIASACVDIRADLK